VRDIDRRATGAPVDHASLDTPPGAIDPVQAGRAWAERRLLGVVGFGCRPDARWTGTLAEAEWLFMASESRGRRFALALIALEAARARWAELTARHAPGVPRAA